MLHAVVLAAETPETSYKGLIISGIVTIIVALIAAWSSRALKRKEATTPANPAANEPQWLKDLRGENRRLRREKNEDEDTIRRYERYLYLARIDPETGAALNGSASPPSPHPSPHNPNHPSPS